MIYIYTWAGNQIFLTISLFWNTDIRRFLWLDSLIECLQVNRMDATSFWFHSRLLLEKAKKPVSYELAMNMLFFCKCFTYFFLRQFWIFPNEHFDRPHFTNDQLLYSNKGVYIWEALCQVKRPCQQIFQKTFLLDSGFFLLSI